jgi:hypothetical protein
MMKTKSFMTFSIVAILLGTVSLVSISISPQNSFAQSNNTITDMNMTDNNSTMMMNGNNQNMAMGKDY